MQKSFSLLFLVALFAFAISQTACKDDACSTENMSFKNNIQPLLKSNGCTDATCHVAGTTTNLYPLSTYVEFKKAAVTDGKVVGAIKHQAGFSAMPKGKGKIDDCDISQIEAWISQGAKDN